MAGDDALEALMRAAAGGERAEAEFLAALHAAAVVLPQPGGTGETRPPAGAHVDLPVVEIRGHRAVPVFTSPAALEGVVPGAPWLRVEVRSLQRMLPEGIGLVVDPYGELTRLLTPDEVAALPGAPPERATLPADAAVTVGAPVEEAPAVHRAVAAFAAAHGGVRAAYRALFTHGDAEEGGRLAVGLLADEGVDGEALLRAAARDLDAPPAPVFSLIVLDPAAPGPIERFMLERTEPFWVRA